ncbi:MAG TPA: NrfD/PsrC family molybdoenzyme membrane anchor subunit [Anaeromyxobacteraceae bacterium]|nr:NrfD/PsrC family molybdoenzyme membrane anchor subunit [Anaeromyxobacteraceae bacterium]
MSVDTKRHAAVVNRVDPLEPVPVLVGRPDDRELNQTLFAPVWAKTRKGWLVLFALALALTGLLFTAIGYTFAVGIGAWGNNIPVAWAYGIVNFVWWIGIGHAGTLISAILLLFQQKWRTSINRFAEAMTLFAVIQALLFPLIHLGRPWFAFWLFPYPSTLGVWPNFKSPLLWDVFAVSTYFTASLLFWYVGLLPDLAALRDSSKSHAKRVVYGIFSLGWRGSARHWRHYRIAYLLLAGLCTPLVLSVHTIVSFDFAVSQLPGWHTTIFPPYFVAGAIFSGFAMVLTLIIPARKAFGFEHVITEKHLENMAKVLLATGLMVAYGYLSEHFIAWYSGNKYEQFVFWNRANGPYAPVYLLMLFCNVLVPQIFWSGRARRSIWVLWIASILVNVGMWCERFVIIVTSLHRDFLPSSWAIFKPTVVDWSILIGTIGFFGLLFLLFLRFVPSVSASEVKELRRELEHEAAPPHPVERAAR